MSVADDYEATAARIRRLAERILQDLVPEDPNVVWARRMAGIREREEIRRRTPEQQAAAEAWARDDLIAELAAEQAARRPPNLIGAP